ncbi:hypothetical protein FO519_007804 [Halicephalobus sp. NKZ332]|nr:hypothetical protein FO519_007804 [Halicephalobus sp. NKZ332]
MVVVAPEVGDKGCPNFCKVRKSDGSCDEICNTELCEFDGGDCVSRPQNSHIIEIVFELNPESFTREKADFLLSQLNSLLNISVSFVFDQQGEIEAFRWTKTLGRESRIIFKEPTMSYEEEDDGSSLSYEEDDDETAVFFEEEFVQILFKMEFNEESKFKQEESVVEFLQSLDSKKSKDIFGYPIAEARISSTKNSEVDYTLVKKVLYSIAVLLLLLVAIVGFGKKRKIIQTTGVHYPGASPEEGKFIINFPEGSSEDEKSVKNHFENPFQKIPKFTTKLHQIMKENFPLNSVPDDLVPLVNAADEEGRTCIHLSILSSTKPENTILEEIKLLEAYGAKLDLEDDFFLTPLHYAIKKRNIFVAEYLIEKDLDEEDEDGRTVSQFAQEKGLHELASMIEKKSYKYQEAKENKNPNKTPIYNMPSCSYYNVPGEMYPSFDQKAIQSQEPKDNMATNRSPIYQFPVDPYYNVPGEMYSNFDLKIVKNQESKKSRTPNKVHVYNIPSHPYYSVPNEDYSVYQQNFQIPEVKKAKKRKIQWDGTNYSKNDYDGYYNNQNYNYGNQYQNQQNPYSTMCHQNYCQPQIPSSYGASEEAQYPYYQQKNQAVQYPTSESDHQGNQKFFFNNYQVYIQQNYNNACHPSTSPGNSQCLTESSGTDTSGYISDPSSIGDFSSIRNSSSIGTSSMANPYSMGNTLMRDPSSMANSSSMSTYTDLYYQCTKLDTDQFFKKIIQ